MQRFAFGAKCGSPGSPPRIAARRRCRAFRRAAKPEPVRRCPARRAQKKRRRVSSARHAARDRVERMVPRRDRRDAKRGRVRAPARRVVAFVVRLAECGVHLFSTSSRFINWLASIVRAAYSAGASAGSGLRSPVVQKLRRILGMRLRSSARKSSKDLRAIGFSLRRQRARQQPRRDVSRAGRRSRAPFSMPRSASTRAASTNCTSFIVTSACSGVLVRSRRTVQDSRVGALKMSMLAGGALRFQNVYIERR